MRNFRIFMRKNWFSESDVKYTVTYNVGIYFFMNNKSENNVLNKLLKT